MIRPIVVDKQSPFLGQECALCKELLAPGDELVICPEDGSRHHVHCWRANNNKCSAYGCTGQGSVISAESGPGPRVIESTPSPQGGSKVRVLPSSSFGCAQSCLLISIAITILLISVGCFGLWAIADYIMLEILGWQYRAPLSGTLSFQTLVTAAEALKNLSLTVPS